MFNNSKQQYKLLQPTFFSLLLCLWQHLSHRRRHQLALLAGLMLVSAITEVISLGAIFSFLGSLTAPDRVFNYPIIADVAHAWGFTSSEQLMLPLTLGFATAALMAGAARMILLWVSNRFGYACGADFSIEAYRRTLYQTYQTHVALNSSTIISGFQKIGILQTVLQSLIVLVSSIIVMLSIMLTLLSIDVIAATFAFVGFTASYGLIIFSSRFWLKRNSQCIATESTNLVKALQEGLGGIRDVLLDGTQQLYCDIYLKSLIPQARALANNVFIGTSPRYAMEVLGMTLLAILAYGMSREGVATALPVLGALALGAQRMVPNFQQFYSAWAGIVGSQASLSDALELLDQPLPEEANQPPASPLIFQKEICFDSVFFRYNTNSPWVLNGFNLKISKGTLVGFVGTTGAGKSTAIDLFMGLLDPTHGQILVDGLPISGKRRRSWQRNIAHVPQSIYLADISIAENIAFGVKPEQIDMERVQQAARQANIADFIESQQYGYKALVGERGIRLSGGQRQRIGIARALYKHVEILVLDEATSALDNATEQVVMDAIEDLSGNLTILLIAHRLTTVQRCDTIVELAEGKVLAQGTYGQLLEHSPSFRAMAAVA